MWQRVLTLVGWVVLVHAGYSFRNHTKELLEMNLDVPHIAGGKLIIQLFAGFLCILIGQLSSLRLRNVRVSPDLKTKPFKEVFARSDFMVFNHRQHAILKRLGASTK